MYLLLKIIILANFSAGFYFLEISLSCTVQELAGIPLKDFSEEILPDFEQLQIEPSTSGKYTLSLSLPG